MVYAVWSDRGEREINEDAVGHGASGENECYLVCDGLGGHEKGEVASRMAVATALEVFGKLSAERADSRTILEQCFLNCQEKVTAYQKEHRSASDMKTTMTMLLKTGGTVRWGHIGDTRVYRFQAGKMVSRTFDHSVPQMLVYSGEIKESQIRFHEDRNRLLKVIGAPWNKPQYEISEASALTDREAFLMCTDGFWEWITEDEMARFLAAARTPAEWLDAMQQHVLRSGRGNNMDNYSAIAVYHGEPWKKRSLFGIFG